jgi:hypothetical protein
MAANGHAPLPTQCGITEVAMTCAKGRHKPNIRRCMLGASLSRQWLGRCCFTCQPSSRIGKTRGSRKRRHHSKPGPRVDSTRLRGARGTSRPYRPNASAPITAVVDPQPRSTVRLARMGVAWVLRQILLRCKRFCSNRRSQSTARNISCLPLHVASNHGVPRRTRAL